LTPYRLRGQLGRANPLPAPAKTDWTELSLKARQRKRAEGRLAGAFGRARNEHKQQQTC
jgi:hypothetical protein